MALVVRTPVLLYNIYQRRFWFHRRFHIRFLLYLYPPFPRGGLPLYRIGG
jgi:hypothetical protein